LDEEMSSQADYVIDRRRLRRQVTVWRVLAFLILAAAALSAAAFVYGKGRGVNGPHIARLTIEGVITGDRGTVTLIRDIAASQANAVIVSIESPGGTTTGAEKLYEEIRQLAAKKPTVAVVGTMAASGGYIAAMGTERIFASGNSLVGSIGVLFQFPNVSKLLDTIGVSYESVKSAPLKAAPNGFEPTSEAARAALAALVADSFAWFKGLVKDRRGMSDAELAIVSDGRIFTGRQGLPLKLVDALGGEREAIAWLETQKHIPSGLPVHDWRKQRTFERLGLLGVAQGLFESVGWDGAARLAGQLQSAESTSQLDGMLAIWQGIRD
jgi:protease IV